MSAKITVMKFGGTSLEDGPAFERVVNIVRSYEGERPVVVVSAMSSVTDALLSSLRMAADGEIRAALFSVEEHLERHLQVARRLGVTARASVFSLIENVHREISELLIAVSASRTTSVRIEDSIAAYGEHLAASLVAKVLDERGLPATYVDAQRCILTNEIHGNARPLLAETSKRTLAELAPLLEAKRVPVLGGFIGATINGVTTTLGRGSSDYTATLVGAILDARETQIWTDVNGVLTADPRLIKTARTVPQLSYEEAAELARFGVKVLHSKMIQPAADQEIPVRICNSRAPEETGTLICARTRETTEGAVKAIAYRTGVTTIEVTSTPAFVANGFMRAIEKISDRHQISFDVVVTSEIGVSLAYEETSALPLVIHDLQEVGSVEVRRDRAIICCVGEGLQAEARDVINVCNTIKDVDSSITWCSTSSNNFISVLDQDCADTVIQRLHHSIFEDHSADKNSAHSQG